MAKTEKFLRLRMREAESFEELELTRTVPNNWESEEEVEEHEGRGRRLRKQAGDRRTVGLVKLKLHSDEEVDPTVNLTDSVAISSLYLCVGGGGVTREMTE